MKETTITRNIMRRVYYAYALRLITHPVTVHGAVICACAVLLTQFVSFPNVLGNLLNKKLNEVHLFLFESAMSTEIWTFVLFGLILVAAISLHVQLRTPRVSGSVAYGQ